MICLDILPGLSVSRKPDFWHEERVSEFTLIEFINENKSLNRSINRSIGRSVGRSVGRSAAAVES
jgi:hypothetical protein